MSGDNFLDLGLSDRTSFWDCKKERKSNLILADSYFRLKMYSKAKRISKCGSFIQFSKCKYNGHRKLVKANFCHDRLCFICNKRNSLNLRQQLIRIINDIYKQRNCNYIFLTLVVSDVKSHNLVKTCNSVFDSFNYLFKYKKVDDMCVGAVRSLKTIVKEDKSFKTCVVFDIYLRVLIAVEPKYFESEVYIKQIEWIRLWKKAMRINFNPVLYIHEIKDSNDLMKVVSEISKYGIENINCTFFDGEVTDKTIKTLLRSLKNRRFIGFAKIFKEVRAKLKLQDLE